MLGKPSIMEKLVSNPIDPAFLTNILKKVAKTDLNLLENVLEKMTSEQAA